MIALSLSVQSRSAAATRCQLRSSWPSSLRRCTVVTSSQEWSRNRLTSSIDSPASRGPTTAGHSENALYAMSRALVHLGLDTDLTIAIVCAEVK